MEKEILTSNFSETLQYSSRGWAARLIHPERERGHLLFYKRQDKVKVERRRGSEWKLYGSCWDTFNEFRVINEDWKWLRCWRHTRFVKRRSNKYIPRWNLTTRQEVLYCRPKKREKSSFFCPCVVSVKILNYLINSFFRSFKIHFTIFYLSWNKMFFNYSEWASSDIWWVSNFWIIKYPNHLQKLIKISGKKKYQAQLASNDSCWLYFACICNEGFQYIDYVNEYSKFIRIA